MFICLEGMAGAGKTTQTDILSKYLASKNIKVFKSAIYEKERRMIISKFIKDIGILNNKNAVMFLFQALHSLQYEEVSDAIKRGDFVVADRWRYYFWTYHLYQNTFNNDIDLMKKVDELVFMSLEPMYFLLDLPASIAYERYVRRESNVKEPGLNIMDYEYFETVIEMYRNIAIPQNWNIVDASMDIEDGRRKVMKLFLTVNYLRRSRSCLLNI